MSRWPRPTPYSKSSRRSAYGSGNARTVEDDCDREASGQGWARRHGSVKLALESPDEARQSRTDPEMLLFYKAEAPKRWTCAVIKRTDNEAFLVTAYPTDAIKEGVRIWPK